MNTQETIVLFPGQGSQHVGMGRSWADESAAADVFQQADEVLGIALSRVCFEGPEDQLHRTDIAQAAIYTTSLACLAALEERGEVDRATITAVAGLSLGEYTALHVAGVFSFADGLKLVRQRGQFMQQAAEATDGTMVALIGADEAQADALCDAARGEDVLSPANFNCPGQVVISGTTAACRRAEAEATTRGLRATPLTVAGAFHTTLMQSAADRMSAALDAITLGQPRIPVLSNVTGEPHANDPATCKQRLVEQITHPVRWEQNVRWLLDHATGRYIEPAPGKALSGMMRRIDRRTRVANFAEAT